LALAKRSDILGVLVTSVLTTAGTFTVYTYLSVFVAGVVGFGPRVWRSCRWASAWPVPSAPNSAAARRTVGARAVS